MCMYIYTCVYAYIYMYIHDFFLQDGPLKTQSDPTTCPEFKYQGMTLHDLIMAKFDERDNDYAAWRMACQVTRVLLWICVWRSFDFGVCVLVRERECVFV